MPDGSNREPARLPQAPRSEDEQFARDIDAFALRLLARPTIRRAVLAVIRDEVHRGTRKFCASTLRSNPTGDRFNGKG